VAIILLLCGTLLIELVMYLQRMHRAPSPRMSMLEIRIGRRRQVKRRAGGPGGVGGGGTGAGPRAR